MKCERCGRVLYPADIYIYIYIYLYLSCRFWHRCGRRFGRPSFGFWFAIWVRYSVATVLRDQRCIRFPLAGLSAKSPQVFPSVSNTCSIFCFFLLYTCGDPSVLRSTPPGVPGSGHRLAPGRAGRGGCSVCSAGQRPSARGVPLAGERFLWHKKWFLLFSTRITLCYLRTCICVHGSLLPPPGRFGIWAPSWLNDGTFASLACAYCLALEVCALTCSFTRSHFDWNQR